LAGGRLFAAADFEWAESVVADYRAAVGYPEAVDSLVPDFFLPADYRVVEASAVVESVVAESVSVADYPAAADCRAAVEPAAVESVSVVDYPAAEDSLVPDFFLPADCRVAEASAAVDSVLAADYPAAEEPAAVDSVLVADYPAAEAPALAAGCFRLSSAEVEEDSSYPCRPAATVQTQAPA
jgi:hypothetical protein